MRCPDRWFFATGLARQERKEGGLFVRASTMASAEEGGVRYVGGKACMGQGEEEEEMSCIARRQCRVLRHHVAGGAVLGGVKQSQQDREGR